MNTNQILTGLELVRRLLEGERNPSYVWGDHPNNTVAATIEAAAIAVVNAAIKELQRTQAQEDLQDTSRADAEHVDGMDSETKYWMQRALASETEVKRLEDQLKEVGERLAQYEDAELEACEKLSANSVLTEDQIAQMWAPHPDGAVLRRPILGWNKVVDFARNVERAVAAKPEVQYCPLDTTAVITTASCSGPWPVIERKEAFDTNPMESQPFITDLGYSKVFELLQSSAPCNAMYSGPWPEERIAACKEAFRKAFENNPMEKCLAAVPAFTSQDPDIAKIIYENLSSLYEEDKEAENAYITDDQIREVFLKAGFTVKPGQADLKPYVFEAARALLALASNKAQGN